MTARTALVVTFDQLPASILGCYGNEWIETPNLDRLASAGFVADQCWSAHVGPTSAETAFAAESCLAALAARGIHSSIVLEDASQTIFPRTAADARVVLSGERGPAAKPDRIPLAELVRAAHADYRATASDSRPRLLWLHARGLEIPAMPPPGFAELYQDEFEDRGVKFDSLSDAERQEHPTAAAGMVSLFDHWLGQLFTGFQPVEQPLLTMVTAAAGAAWQPWPNSCGESDSLRSQMVQVPWLAQVSGASEQKVPAGMRSSQLLSPRRLAPLLEWWFCEPEVSWPDWLARNSAAQIITTSGTNSRRMTTPDWAAIFPGDRSRVDSKPLLFRKPEDYWEVNTLADVLPETVDELQRAISGSGTF